MREYCARCGYERTYKDLFYLDICEDCYIEHEQENEQIRQFEELEAKELEAKEHEAESLKNEQTK